MKNLVEQAREVARELLETGQVDLVIGWEKGTFDDLTTPVFIRKPEDVDRLIINEYCLSSPSSLLLYYKNHPGKIALFVKGCDARGAVRLINDQQFDRDKLYLIGIPCTGLKQKKEDGQVVDHPKCEGCTHPTPTVYDKLLGGAVEPKNPEKRFAVLDQPGQGWDYWAEQFQKCIRCYACQRVCPACNCRECIFVDQCQDWIERRVDETENAAYGLIRAYHVVGRCVECGECERVCPMNLPIMKLNKRFAADIEELFGPFEAGVELDEKSPLGYFNYDDPEEFM